jgi:hypothetical protein
MLLRKFGNKAAHLSPNYCKEGMIAHPHHAFFTQDDHVLDPQIFRLNP